jgi:hypothetical protein
MKFSFMKNKIIFLVICMAALTATAQYPQKLPLDFNSFFSVKATGVATLLEKGEYLVTVQDATNPVKENQWNRSGKSVEWNGVSASLENSTLSYSTYIDNNAGKAIVLNPEIDGVRTAVYSLTSGSEYTNETFYLSALINISKASGSGDQFLSFDGNYSGNQQRARVCIKSSDKKGTFNIGLGWKAVPETWSGDLQYGTTYLIVLKVSPSSKGAESATLFLNPKIGGKEAVETAIGSVSVPEADLKRIRGILIRQRGNVGAKIAGIRFGNKWDEVVK